MKVICIDGVKPGDFAKTLLGSDTVNPDEYIFEGEVYTVARELVFLGDPCYILFERPPLSFYRKVRFAPVSNIDETEFERNYNKALALKQLNV